MKNKKIAALATIACVLASATTGCGNKNTEPGSEAPLAVQSESAVLSESRENGSGRPVLSYWTANSSDQFAKYEDTYLMKGLMEQTGIDIKVETAINPVEQFNLMVVDGEFPDIVEYDWATYPGGPDKAIADGVILPLNDIFEKYCPNISAYLEAHPELDKAIKTDSGNYYCFPMFWENPDQAVWAGPMIRTDWLDDLGLEVPDTIDELHDVLVAFKEEKGAETPFTFAYADSWIKKLNVIAYAYDSFDSYYLGEDGKVHWGPAEQNYKAYLMTMAKWYGEGLLDPDFVSAKSAAVTAKISSGSAGFAFGAVGGGLGVWQKAGQEIDPKFKMEGIPYLVAKEGDARTGQARIGAANLRVAISTSCEDLESAARLLDYGYSEEGTLLYNYGIEGESYTMVDGKPIYTDTILNNPDGLTVSQAMSMYIRANSDGPFIQQYGYFEQYTQQPEQKAALKLFADTDGIKYCLPNITPTQEESKEYAAIMNDINTYRDEMEVKFILGTESLDNFDKYVETIESMGLSRALEIQNTALERYNAR